MRITDDEVEDTAIRYLALSPRPRLEEYLRIRVQVLELSAPDAVSFALAVRSATAAIMTTTKDPDSKRSAKNAAYWRQYWAEKEA